jgi:ribonuclease T2
MKKILFAAMIGACIASAAIARSHHDRDDNRGETGQFDYYLMSLSWSPSYCEAHPGEPEQCAHKGFGFVLHGLWPQNRDGSWPQHCNSDAQPDAATIERTLAFMPSRHLIEHEWQTHGSCTGLDPGDYFGLADRAFASVKIPVSMQTPLNPPTLAADDIVAAFAQANPGLDDRMITVECHEGSELTEVRVCLNKDSLAPQACGGRVRNSCRYGKLRIPAVR